MAGEETKNWTFHHFGVIVEDMDKAVEFYKLPGFIDFPSETEKAGNQPSGGTGEVPLAQE